MTNSPIAYERLFLFGCVALVPGVKYTGSRPAAAGCGGRRKSRRADGKEPAEEGKGSAVMALAGEAGLAQKEAGLCGE